MLANTSAWLGPAAQWDERTAAMLMATNRHGLAGSFAAVRDTDLRAQLARIERPTLVIAGAFDRCTAGSVTSLAPAIDAAISSPGLAAVHLSNVEFPPAFEGAGLSFLRAD
ncbi:alpha/beta fold hydrolase [Pseudomonas aeruginosa]|uniref:alpha/beta fold hydrolase n=1 Tax=Pseudomonas aeruginosa TaxID=287 RepID=UPI003592F456